MVHHSGALGMSEAAALPTRSWAELLDDCGTQLKACVAYVSEEHDVAGLCPGLAERSAELDCHRADCLCK